MAKKPASNDRRKRIDDIRTQQKKAERRTTYLFVGVAIVLAGGLIAGAVIFGGGGTGEVALDAIGVKKADAGCGEVKEADKELGGQHVGPGAQDEKLRNVQTVTYETIPPTGGDHYGQTAAPNKQFYDRDDAVDARPENLVHNLEHGYVVVWYDGQAGDDDVKELERVARNVENAGPRYGPKLIVAPYTRGDFEGENNIGLSAWGVSQLCESVSGEVIDDFVHEYRGPDGPKSKAPEKAAG